MSVHHRPFIVCDHPGCPEAIELGTQAEHPEWLHLAHTNYCGSHADEHRPARRRPAKRRAKKSKKSAGGTA